MPANGPTIDDVVCYHDDGTENKVFCLDQPNRVRIYLSNFTGGNVYMALAKVDSTDPYSWNPSSFPSEPLEPLDDGRHRVTVTSTPTRDSEQTDPQRVLVKVVSLTGNGQPEAPFNVEFGKC